MCTLAERKQKVLNFSGACVPTVVPYNAKGEVDLSQVPAYLAYLVRGGAKASTCTARPERACHCRATRNARSRKRG